MAPRTLRPGQRAELWIHDITTGDDLLRYTSDTLLFEAPNWTPDGESLLVNGDGHLFWVPVEGDPDATELEQVDLGGVPPINNDHVLSPDGSTIYVSAEDWHIHAVPLPAGGTSRRVTNERAEGRLHFLHGVSPDDQTLAYIGLQLKESGNWGGGFTTDIWTVPTAGGPDTRLTDEGSQHDGSEYSPDGGWLWFNSERHTDVPGAAQVFRMRLGNDGSAGGPAEQLTDDERVNWFPHLSPDGSRVVYISFPTGTLGHPENLDVILRELLPDGAGGWSGHRDLVHLFGGQGTINVNSWAPDSRRFAYVRYPMR